MQEVVRKWRNSAAIRIPTAILDAVRLRLGQPVDVRAEKRPTPQTRRPASPHHP